MSPSKRNARRGNVLVIGLVALVALLVLAVVTFWMLGGGPVEPDAGVGHAVADRFLEQIRAGEAKQAWESTTAEFKSAEGAEVFQRSVKKRAWLKQPLEFESAQPANVQSLERTEYVYRAPGGKNSVRLLVTNERGTAKVDRWTPE
jgi:hypothetical protein